MVDKITTVQSLDLAKQRALKTAADEAKRLWESWLEGTRTPPPQIAYALAAQLASAEATDCAHCKKPLEGCGPWADTPDHQGVLHVPCRAAYIAGMLGFVVGDLVESHDHSKIDFTSKKIRGFDVHAARVFVYLEGETTPVDVKDVQHTKPKGALLVPDRDELMRFVEAMFKCADRAGLVSFRVFMDNVRGERPVRISANRLDDPEFVPLMMIVAEQAASWYKPAVFAPPICTFKNHLNAKTDNIREGVVLSAECDQSPGEARVKLEAVLGPATAVVASGGEWVNPETGEIEPKLHLHWRLEKPARALEDLARLYEARSLAATLVGGDRTAISIVHPIRWPGSVHRKKTPKLARIVALAEDVEIELGEAVARLRAATGITELVTPNRISDPGQREASDPSLVGQVLPVIPNDSNLKEHDWNYWNTVGMTIWASTSGSEEGRLAFHAWSAKAGKYDHATTEDRWQHYFRSPPTKLGFGSLVYRARQADPEWRYENLIDARLTESVGAIIAQLMREKDEPDDAGTSPAPRPFIKYGPLSEMADSAAAVLKAAEVPFYQRGDKLVRPVVLPVQSFGGKMTSTARLVEVDFHYLRDMLCRNSRWMKFDKRAKKWLAAFPSGDAAHVLLKRFGDWDFPVLAGIITTPTLRPDGTILQDAGYDPATQLLLIDPPPMRSIPEHPTRDDALAALRLIKDLLAEFSFADDDGVSLAVALSAVVSTVCRGAYPIVPVHIGDAPAAGSGKSYLLSCVSWIATGQAMPVLGAGKDEGELGKRLDAAVIGGQSLICIDNVVGEIGGEAICRLTEQWRPQVRILGLTKMVDVDARGISFFANGNNIIVVGDLCRRVVRYRLDAKTDHPEQRVFKRNPMKEILADRGAYIAACLTICRAYRVAGQPGLLPPLASYGEWSDTVRSALVWLGEADPVKSQDKSHADDPEAMALLTLMNVWIDVFGAGAKNAQTVRHVIAVCDAHTTVNESKWYIHDGLRNAVLAVMPVQHNYKPDATALGYWLRSKKDRRIGKLRFLVKAATGHNPALWWVEEE